MLLIVIFLILLVFIFRFYFTTEHLSKCDLLTPKCNSIIRLSNINKGKISDDCYTSEANQIFQQPYYGSKGQMW